MSMHRRTIRHVLKDRRGISTSLPDVLAGVSMDMVTYAAVGAAMVGVLGFWALSSASADTSSEFQGTNIAFQKAVHASDVVVGIDANRVGLLKDVDAGCEVQTWQQDTRDGKLALRVDTKTVDGTCTQTTPLLAANSSDDSKELAYDIKAPEFSYSNLGGREITYDATGTPTLITGAKPAGVKSSDWDDTRPYKVSLALQSLSDDASVTTKNAVSTGYTNVVNVSAAADSLRYVPAPSSDPIPGPVTITNVSRSTTTGQVFAAAREGISVTFNGAVCASGPTKVDVSYAQQGPSEAPAVNTVLNQVLTGGDSTVNLGQVPNGSSGAVQVAASCVDDGVVVKATTGYTQKIPATTLTVKQNADLSKHDLSWVAVSSLPTQFKIFRSFDGEDVSATPYATTNQLAYQSTYDAGTNLGLTSIYSVVAVIDSNESAPATGVITTPLPAPAPTVVTADDQGADWTTVTCPAYSTAQYAERHYQQTGTSTTVSWTALGAWSTSTSKTGVTTPSYGRTVTEVHARCAATKSNAVSPDSVSQTDAYYMPEALQSAVARSATAGTAYAGAREGITVLSTGARCYGTTKTDRGITYVPQAPSGQSNASWSGTVTPTGGADSVNLAGVANGSTGYVDNRASCSGVKSGVVSVATGYTQGLPTPATSANQGANGNQHIVTWADVSSLPVVFTVSQAMTVGDNLDPQTTTGLSRTYNYAAGTTYGNDMAYAVRAAVGDVTSSQVADHVTTPWPAVPDAKSIGYTRTGAGGDYYGGRITWAYTGTCPAGTTNNGRVVENSTGQSNGTYSTTVRYVSGYTANANGYTWDPSYAYEGYGYGVRIDNICISNVTNLQSPLNSTQSAHFLTPISTPEKPVWNSYNTTDKTSPTNWTPNTPLNSTTPNLRVQYKTYCSAGSTVVSANFTSRSWAGNDFNHVFPFSDYWQLLDGMNSANVTYYDAHYKCDTFWTTSALSPDSVNTTVTVRR